ncbi:MAG: prepilin-type N-terminal cleavage/methylation domain-containing protein [Zoogloeaceae bacterium]|nr:prepilin-type N-terminal cleavage/methylation domain-containing protein [Zoogloeaceae bacterium]
MKSLACALQRGFTLVEVVVVLAIAAILLLFALPVFYLDRVAPSAQESPLLETSRQRENRIRARRVAIRAHVDKGLVFASLAKMAVMESISDGYVKKVTVAYPGEGAAPHGSYRGFEYKPSTAVDAVARIAINPLVAGSAYGRVGEGTIWVETDGEKAPRFGLKLTVGFGGRLANGQPRVPLLIDPDGNLVDPDGNSIDPDGNPVGPDGHYNVSSMASSIIWGCSLGDGYSVAKYAQFVPPDCRHGVMP